MSLALTIGLSASLAQAELIREDDFATYRAEQVKLGQLLFYDKILSGNKNIACATCHHHDYGSADGLSLGIGEGGSGLGPDRTPGAGEFAIEERIPRSAPPLWNLGHKSVSMMFHDGRLSVSDDFDSGFDSPAKELLPAGLQSPVAAQALFPISSNAEMAGHPEENLVAAAFAERIDLGWEEVTLRIKELEAYVPLFVDAFPDVKGADDITIVEIGNAIGAFIETEWRNYDSLYDAYLQDGTPLPDLAEQGRELFFGRAGCSNCHNGPLFTDENFYAMGLPQFGPGKLEDGHAKLRDLGRMMISGDPDDAYRFRTLSLRNVALTAPYGHNGAYPTLREMIMHMANPEGMREQWTPEMAELPEVPWLKPIDFALMHNADEMVHQAAVLDATPVRLSEAEIDAIEAFLHCLTGTTALERPLGRPDLVPSGLPVD